MLLYKVEDRRTHQYFMGGKYPGGDAIVSVRDALQGLGAAETAVTLAEVQAHASNVAKAKVRSVLSMMKGLGVVREMRGSRFRLLDADVPAARMEEVAREYAGRQAADREKLDRMASYAQSAMCRWKLLLDYFQENDSFERCDTCDNCVEPLESRIAAPGSELQPMFRPTPVSS